MSASLNSFKYKDCEWRVVVGESLWDTRLSMFPRRTYSNCHGPARQAIIPLHLETTFLPHCAACSCRLAHNNTSFYIITSSYDYESPSWLASAYTLSSRVPDQTPRYPSAYHQWLYMWHVVHWCVLTVPRTEYLNNYTNWKKLLNHLAFIFCSLRFFILGYNQIKEEGVQKCIAVCQSEPSGARVSAKTLVPKLH